MRPVDHGHDQCDEPGNAQQRRQRHSHKERFAIAFALVALPRFGDVDITAVTDDLVARDRHHHARFAAGAHVERRVGESERPVGARGQLLLLGAHFLQRRRIEPELFAYRPLRQSKRVVPCKACSCARFRQHVLDLPHGVLDFHVESALPELGRGGPGVP